MLHNEKPIDQRQFESLLEIQCTAREICDVLGVSMNTLQKFCKKTYGKTFDAISPEFKSKGKASLRRQGLKLAESNPAVWIFLAKNYLGMADTVAPEPDNEAVDGLANAFKSASKSIGSLSGLAQVPDAPAPAGSAEEKVDG